MHAVIYLSNCRGYLLQRKFKMQSSVCSTALSHSGSLFEDLLEPTSYSIEAYPKPKDNLIVIRDITILESINELRHVLNDTCETSMCYAGSYLDIPVIDMDAMLQYLCSDLDKMIVGDNFIQACVTRYVITEVLDHDAEFTPLLRGVMELVTSTLQHLSRYILEHPIDHYVPHRYELQEILPSGSLVLRRIDL